MALLSIPVRRLWALRPHSPHQAWHKAGARFWKNSGCPQTQGPRLCRSGVGLGPLDATNTCTHTHEHTHIPVQEDTCTGEHTGNYMPTQMHTHYTCALTCAHIHAHITHTSPTPRAASMLCTAPPREPGVKKLSLGWRQSEHRQRGYKADPATLQSRKAGSGAAGKKAGPREDEDRRDTDVALRGSLHWSSEGSERHSHATPHTRMCAQGSPACPAETHTEQTEGRGPQTVGDPGPCHPTALRPTCTAPLTQPPHLGAVWGLVSFQGLASKVAGREGPRSHFPQGKHIYPGNGKSNQCSVRACACM